MATTIIAFLIGLLALLGIHMAPPSTPDASSGSIRVIARSCPAGVTAPEVSADQCDVWLDGAAFQVTDLQGNAWGMNASRDAGIAGSPVIYQLDGMAFGTYILGQPTLPPGFSSAFIAGAQVTTGGQPRIELNQARPQVDLTVYFLK